MTKELNRSEEHLQTVCRNSPFCDLRDRRLAGSTTQAYASGINAAGDGKGTWTDTSDITHEFLLSSGVCSQIDLARATGTGVNRIKKNAHLIGACFDVLSEEARFQCANEGDPRIFRQEL